VIPGYGALLSQVIEPSRFPALERAIASGALDDEDDPDREFRFGLERVLDGIELLIGQTDTAGRRPSPWGRRP
jgi:hypothetical protein